MSSPIVSVVIPVFNRREALRRAVLSVLLQSFEDYELIVVDDGSTEPVADVIADQPRVRLLRHRTNSGAAAARNTGAREATAKYIAFLDSDDAWHPEKLARQVAFMRSKPHIYASCTGFALINELGMFDQRLPPPDSNLREILKGCRISPGSTLMIERRLCKVVGAMDETLYRLEDWDWLILATRYTPIKGLREVLVDVHHDRYAHVNEAQFVAAAQRMADYAGQGRYDLSRADRRILLSAIQYELAATYYYKRRFGQALRALGTSFFYYPWKRPGLLLAALKAVGTDLSRATGLRATRG